MRPFANRFTLLSLLILTATLVHADFVGKPNVYRHPNVAAIQKLNALYQNGSIGFAEYQTRMAELGHTVTSIGRTEQASTTMSYDFTPALASSQTLPNPTTAQVSVPSPVFIFQSPYSPLKISVRDIGYGLTPEAIEEIRILLSEIPIEQLKGLTDINVASCGTASSGLLCLTPDIQGSRMTIYPVKVDPFNATQDAKNVKTTLTQGLSAYVFETILTDAQRLEWAIIQKKNSPVQGLIFGLTYQSYLRSSEDALKAVTSFYNEDPSSAQKNPESLQQILFMTALMTSPNGATRFFDSEGHLQYSQANRTGQWLTIGSLHFALEGNTIVGVTDQDVFAPPTTPLKAITYKLWDPIQIPQIVLDRIPVRK